MPQHILSCTTQALDKITFDGYLMITANLAYQERFRIFN
jgi:hypothetical protein